MSYHACLPPQVWQLLHWELIKRAGEGNRTLVSSLGSWRSTIELHPRKEFQIVDFRLQIAMRQRRSAANEWRGELCITSSSPARETGIAHNQTHRAGKSLRRFAATPAGPRADAEIRAGVDHRRINARPRCARIDSKDEQAAYGNRSRLRAHQRRRADRSHWRESPPRANRQ
jgi:hypothetical protein